MNLNAHPIIGELLYKLGFAVANSINGTKVPTIINLLQCPPVDRRLAEVLLDFSSIVRLIEIRQNQELGKEKARFIQLKAAIGEDVNMIELSKSIHWVIETADDVQSSILRIIPYLDARSGEQQGFNFGQFIEAIAKEVVDAQPKFRSEDWQYYLSLVAMCQGSGQGSTGGLLLVVDVEGNLTYVVLSNLLELRLQHSDYVCQKLKIQD